MLGIEWTHDGRQPLFPVKVLQPEPSTDIFGAAGIALLDTGSTISGVTSELADRLALKGIGKRPLISARSEDQAERYVFRIGLEPTAQASGSLPFIFPAIIGFELRRGARFDALIGMDILSQCDLVTDRNGRCRLSFG